MNKSKEKKHKSIEKLVSIVKNDYDDKVATIKIIKKIDNDRFKAALKKITDI
mgnify:CR=1 FL=1|tara:strand:- start:499 stop:654 length:156 start_codon:yes stop_codon:yes gene_type:complete